MNAQVSYTHPTEQSLKAIKSRMTDLLQQGMGECIWDIGIEGMLFSIRMLLIAQYSFVFVSR